jgi:RNA polymerase sigma-70 factor (ECF subfamily)
MIVREDGHVAGGPLLQGSDGADEGHAGAIVGGGIDAFRDYLTQLARREIGTDLAAKVSASDIVQETFLAAGRDIGQFEGASVAEMRGWLRGILKHLVNNTRRRYRGTGKRRLDLEVAAGGVEDERAGGWWATISASATSPSGCAMRQEREQALRRALTTLPEHYRLVIRWRHQEQMSFDAIAGRLDVSPEAARKVWGRALLRLREALGPDHDPR